MELYFRLGHKVFSIYINYSARYSKVVQITGKAFTL